MLLYLVQYRQLELISMPVQPCQYLRDRPIGTAAQWSCQDWIIEAVNALHEDIIIQPEEFHEAIEILQEDYRKF